MKSPTTVSRNSLRVEARRLLRSATEYENERHNQRNEAGDETAPASAVGHDMHVVSPLRLCSEPSRLHSCFPVLQTHYRTPCIRPAAAAPWT